jgi:N-acetyl sugar amidotransferase
MDTTDPEIVFDKNCICNHCLEFDSITSKSWFPNKEGERMLSEILSKVKNEGTNKEYDCIIGLSGGVDSSYLAIVLKKYNLRPLVVHIDAGWNTEIAVSNIEKIVKYCDYDLYTHVMDWEEIKDLQVAYLKAGVANQDVVQDHAFFATLYHFAVKNKISYIISGGNIATESVFPQAWHHSAMDAINLKSIHKKYGTIQLKKYKTISFFKYYFYYPFVKGMKTIRPLNYLPYNRREAIEALKKEVDYKEYGKKHSESRFTKFFQNYYLPKKFGYDKRKPHLSSQILSGEISRNEAIMELKTPVYRENELRESLEYIGKKLEFKYEELNQIINSDGNHYRMFSNWDKYHGFAKKLQKFLENKVGRRIKNYS